MRTIRILILGLATTICLGAAATPALATPAWEQCAEGTEGAPTKYTEHQCLKAASENKGKWQWNEVTGTESVTGHVTVALKDTKILGVITVEVKCTYKFAGKIGPKKLSKIEEFNEIHCSPGENCGTLEEVTVRNFPWQPELAEESREVFAKGTPGWTFTCKTAGIKVTDECTGENTSAAVSNKAIGSELLVLADFDAKSGKGTCSLGGAESFVIEGSIATAKTSGAGLRVHAEKPGPCKTKKTKWVFCSGGNELASGAVKAANGNPTTLKSTIKGVKTEIQCTKGTFEMTLENGGELRGPDKLESCSVTLPAGTCVINGKAITTEPIVGQLEGPVPGGPPEIKLKGTPRIALIKIETCEALKGEYPLTGEQKCKVDAKYETEQAEHELICEEAGSKLKIESEKKLEAATLAMTAKGPLEGGANWSMQLN